MGQVIQHQCLYTVKTFLYDGLSQLLHNWFHAYIVSLFQNNNKLTISYCKTLCLIISYSIL